MLGFSVVRLLSGSWRVRHTYTFKEEEQVTASFLSELVYVELYAGSHDGPLHCWSAT